MRIVSPRFTRLALLLGVIAALLFGGIPTASAAGIVAVHNTAHIFTSPSGSEMTRVIEIRYNGPDLFIRSNTPLTSTPTKLDECVERMCTIYLDGILIEVQRWYEGNGRERVPRYKVVIHYHHPWDQAPGFLFP